MIKRFKAYLFLLTTLFTLSCFATPDWNTTNHEEFLGSNNEVYAVIKTTIDNQGSYYASRHIKTFLEYSKSDNALINQEIISEVAYTIDVAHIDPNTKPKITKSVKTQNKRLLFSTLTVDYDRPVAAIHQPDWIKRLSWEHDGIYLDKKLLILPKEAISETSLPLDQMMEKPIQESIGDVFQDQECIYISLRFGEALSYENTILRVEPYLSKLVNHWSTKLSDYVLISEHDNKEQANEAGLEIIKTCHDKDYYAVNVEIWSNHIDAEQTRYYLVHRPFDLPIAPDKIQTLESIIKQKTKVINSNEFVEKWIPFIQPEELPEESDPELSPEKDQ